MAVSAERVVPRVDRVEEHGDQLMPEAIVTILKAKTEAQAHTPPDLSVLYIPVLPAVGNIVNKMMNRFLGWLENVSDKHTISDYNPLD